MSDEIRVMPGMVLVYQPDGYHPSILTVRTVRRAKKWTAARLQGFSGNPTPGGVWATSDYSVRFPDHLVRPPFRVLTGSQVIPELGLCDHHATYDDEKQPTGPACGAPATHIIHWPTERRWSLACADHISPDEFEDDAPPRIIKELPS